ncbi:MAG TPA: ribosome small subunit-dependent GTPase A [Sphingobacteriaceae bacterium]
MSLLINFGFNSHFNQLSIPYLQKGLNAGRVTSIQGFIYHLIGEAGEIEAELSGALLNSKENWELPKVGDWVVFVPVEERGYIIEVLERQTILSRKMPGKETGKQVLVANVDYAFIVQSLDQDFNLMRLQRYLHQIKESQIAPIVIINKADLVSEPSAFINLVDNLGYHVPVILTSTVTGLGLEELKTQIMQEGKTYVLLGSSGVGKSSLLNSLLMENTQQTSHISTSNNKGRHTTTFRYLTLLSNGSILIDTPGMREFGLTADATEESRFIHPLIDELAGKCKYPDCRHELEPGCAVVAAVNDNELPEVVYRSYLKLLKEQQHYQLTVTEKRRNERQFGKISREIQSLKRKWKS